MSAAQLFNIPVTSEQRAEWVFANASSHNSIVDAILAQKGQNLTRFSLDPLNPTNIQDFLLGHQFMHDQMDQVLGIGGNDYTSFDPNDPSAVDYLWQQHANEHILAETQLGISS